MKLLRVHVISADTCGGLLDGVDIQVRSPLAVDGPFEPLCLIGPNGTGKSQFLQIVAEIFQSLFHVSVPSEERQEANENVQFELEYLIRPSGEDAPIRVRATRRPIGSQRPSIVMERLVGDDWVECDPRSPEASALLPSRVVGYTSGDNETLSLPFLVSRSGYAEDVRDRAFSRQDDGARVAETRLMLIDYATHLEVLVANLLLGTDEQRSALLAHAGLRSVHSFRCIVQLAHGAVPRLSAKRISGSKRKGIQLTSELEDIINRLQRASTCHSYDDKSESYVFDFLVSPATTEAFSTFWATSLDLFSSLHKLAMLNDLAIPRSARERFKRDTKSRHFASRLPEPQDEDKVFRFERVIFSPLRSSEPVDYVSLSDGEHQFLQILGMFCMLSSQDVVFLLDEPESHFNPRWRIQLMSQILDLPGDRGATRRSASTFRQDCFITTHAPFVPSDMSRAQVLIFGKDQETGRVVVRSPDIETYGATFDAILAECFGVRPPMSEIPRTDIQELSQSDDPAAIQAGLDRLGFSVEKVLLAERLRKLRGEGSP